MSNPKRLTAIEIFVDGTINFECTSEMYGRTQAGGKAETALKTGFVALGDGCDYVLTDKEKEELKAKLEELKPKQEKTSSYKYYESELNRLNPVDTINFQLRGESGQTKWMTLNLESIEALETFLNAYKLLLKE